MELKFKVGQYRHKVKLEPTTHKRLKIWFHYDKDLVEEVKCMEGAKWHPDPEKVWTVADSARNWFTINYLTGQNPYARYDSPLLSISPSRAGLYEHQVEGFRFIITRLQCILAMEPGCGKTLCAIESLEWFTKTVSKGRIHWVAPRSALVAAYSEFKKWKAKVRPDYYTYEAYRSAVKSDKIEIPQLLVLDESARVKTPTAQRSIACKHVTEVMREKYKNECMVLLMSGAPAPKSPADWWMQCEISCPGFIREGTYQKFQARLGLIKIEENNVTGGMYPRLVTWWDDERKCATCGLFKDAFCHDGEFMAEEGYHLFKPSVNEVHKLYNRLKGLVLVKFKKDVLSHLPEKVYRTIECKPTDSIRRAAKLIIRSSQRAIEALTLTRELSDGFQYIHEESLEETCDLCRGLRLVDQPIYIGPSDLPVGSMGRLKHEYWEKSPQECPNCDGKGKVKVSKRVTKEIPCPKDQVIKSLLEEYEEVGRVVIYGGFTGSIDRIIKLVQNEGWHWIRVDGRGWKTSIPGVIKDVEMNEIFQEHKNLYPKVAFVGHPGSGGIGLTLTASPVEIFYSNDFNADYRIQAIERGHRPGMDLNKGLTIVDIIHLETDRKVLDNLEKKIDLQSLSLGDLSSALEKADNDIRYF
jgi:SNF2 family DNA or RNA helicase